MFGHEYLNYSQQLKNLANHIKECEAIIIGLDLVYHQQLD